jgi:hypothetical protein
VPGVCLGACGRPAHGLRRTARYHLLIILAPFNPIPRGNFDRPALIEISHLRRGKARAQKKCQGEAAHHWRPSSMARARPVKTTTAPLS